jgi:hypothetical protein
MDDLQDLADSLFPPSNGTDTSDAAAESVADSTAAKRQRVYELLLAEPQTCDDLEQLTGWAHQTVSARVWELHDQLHRIRDSGQRKMTRRKRLAIVWRVVDEANPWEPAKKADEKKDANVNISNKLAGAVARDLKALFQHAHEHDADKLVTGALLVLMEHLLQKHEKHLATLKTRKKYALDDGIEDVPRVTWAPPELPEPAPPTRPQPAADPVKPTEPPTLDPGVAALL